MDIQPIWMVKIKLGFGSFTLMNCKTNLKIVIIIIIFTIFYSFFDENVTINNNNKKLDFHKNLKNNMHKI
jgi:hypothetical protein